MRSYQYKFGHFFGTAHDVMINCDFDPVRLLPHLLDILEILYPFLLLFLESFRPSFDLLVHCVLPDCLGEHP